MAAVPMKSSLQFASCLLSQQESKSEKMLLGIQFSRTQLGEFRLTEGKCQNKSYDTQEDSWRNYSVYKYHIAEVIN